MLTVTSNDNKAKSKEKLKCIVLSYIAEQLCLGQYNVVDLSRCKT